ncbi:MAG TPA: hypothetical protein ENK46_11310 [Flavobacteriia bacterium]|jgi:hypothetical protein|nr:hypothetical protein [Flavobacteriia bacterium]
MKAKLLITIAYLYSVMNMTAQDKLAAHKDSYIETNTTASIDIFKDYIIVINIWDPNKPQEIEILNQLVEKYKGKKVQFIAITDRISTEIATSSSVFKYQHLAGEEAEKLFNKYQTGMFKTYPIHIILDKERRVVFKKQRITKNIDKKIAKKLDALLSKMQNGSNAEATDEVYTMNN